MLLIRVEFDNDDQEGGARWWSMSIFLIQKVGTWLARS